MCVGRLQPRSPKCLVETDDRARPRPERRVAPRQGPSCGAHLELEAKPKHVLEGETEVSSAANRAKSALLTPRQRVGPACKVTPGSRVSNPAENAISSERLHRV